MTDVARLNDQFGISEQLSFQVGHENLVFAQINNQHAAARICQQGAQLIEWTPRDAKPVVWLSKDAKFSVGKAIRGGVPVCWPWFGPHAQETSYPAHGFARTLAWDVITTGASEDGSTQIGFRLRGNESTHKLWPHKTTLECHIKIGATLDIELVTINEGTSSVSLTEALHTYFAIGDIEQIAITGLENTVYLDKVDAGLQKTQQGAVTINSEVDRIYVGTTTGCVIEDPVLQRKIHIRKSGSNSTVVWNPWIDKANRMGDLGEEGYRHMVCVESGNAAGDSVTIAPGESHCLQVSYQLEKTG